MLSWLTHGPLPFSSESLYSKSNDNALPAVDDSFFIFAFLLDVVTHIRFRSGSVAWVTVTPVLNFSNHPT